MELEQLMAMNVTTVSKREQSFNSAPAAIYSITQEDIRRSGATSLPEVFKLAPGIEVARINPSTWAITSRGFNSQFATKLLIMIDGRSIYSPLFSGVYWDTQMPSLDDIQRIEVIRGPGASLWGANAVNGVINIITYDSEQTPGTRFVAGAGNEERGFFRARRGIARGDVTARVNVQARSVDDGLRADAHRSSNDDFNALQVGSRIDWRPTITEKAMVNVGYLKTDKHTDVFIPGDLPPLVEPRNDLGAEAWHVLSSWLHEMDNSDALYLQSYAEIEKRTDPLNLSERTTYDLELQYNHQATAKHRVTWGGNYRLTIDDLQGSFMLFGEDAHQKYDDKTMFIQDEYQTLDNMTVTLGVKLENRVSNEVLNQPTMRIAWQANDANTLWAAASRAARTPSRLERSLEFRGQAENDYGRLLAIQYPGVKQYSVVIGNDDFKSEIMYAYEAGWRWHPNNKLLIDVTTYQNKYDKLLTYVIPPPDDRFDYRYFEQNYIGLVFLIDNVSKGESNGLEIAADYMYSSEWKTKIAYTYFNFVSYNHPPLVLTPSAIFERQSPEHQLQFTSYHELSNDWEFNWNLRWVDEISIVGQAIPSYMDANVQLGKRVGRHLNVSLIGKNLLDAARVEFFDPNYGPSLTELQRSLFLQIDWSIDGV